MSDDVFRVEVVGCFTDTPTQQWTSVQTVKAFSQIRHLDMRFSGWTIGQRCLMRVGVNTVPAILETLVSNVSMEELTIDLECLSRSSVLTTFGCLISTKAYPGLQKLNVTSSGEESTTKQVLRELGKAFRNLDSIQDLKLTGMDPEHLSVILQNMQKPYHSCPCFPSCKRPCPRVLPSCDCGGDEIISSETEGVAGYPKHLIIEKARLFHRAMTYLVHLVVDEKKSSISKLTLRDCVHYTEDLGCLTYLLKGQSILRELSLERLRICSFPGASSPWWNPSAMKGPDSIVSDKSRLAVVSLLDCKGSLQDVETMTSAMIQNTSLERLILQYSTPITASMILHSLNGLHDAIVLNNQSSSLSELQVLAGPQMEAYRLHQLSALLGHPNCVLETLTLHLGSGPYQLDVLAVNFPENVHLKHLSLSGDEEMDVTTLESFVTMLQNVPHIISLEMDFPGIHEAKEDVLRVFEANTTLKNVRVQHAPRAYHTPINLSFYGLRNRIRHLLLSRDECTNGTWKEVLHLMLAWYESPADDRVRLLAKDKNLVFLSSLWCAMMECPSLVSELGPLGHL
jgi:hypothetical protein